MQTPAIREKISQLSRPLKLLFSVLIIVMLILAAEGLYYFLIRPTLSPSKQTVLKKTGPQYLVEANGEQYAVLYGEVENIDNEQRTLSIHNDNKEVDVVIPSGAKVYFLPMNWRRKPDVSERKEVDFSFIEEGDNVAVYFVIQEEDIFFGGIALVSRS